MSFLNISIYGKWVYTTSNQSKSPKLTIGSSEYVILINCLQGVHKILIRALDDLSWWSQKVWLKKSNINSNVGDNFLDSLRNS